MQKPAPMIQEMMIMIRKREANAREHRKGNGELLVRVLVEHGTGNATENNAAKHAGIEYLDAHNGGLAGSGKTASMPLASAREPVALSTMLFACRNRKNDIRAISEAWPLFFFAMAPAMPTQNRIERLLMINISDW